MSRDMEIQIWEGDQQTGVLPRHATQILAGLALHNGLSIDQMVVQAVQNELIIEDFLASGQELLLGTRRHPGKWWSPIESYYKLELR